MINEGQVSTDELLVAQGWFIQDEAGTHLRVYGQIKKGWKKKQLTS